MKEVEARKLADEIRQLLEKHGAHFEYIEVKKPDLKFIKFDDVLIKVENRA